MLSEPELITIMSNALWDGDLEMVFKAPAYYLWRFEDKPLAP